jgi:hypothetical protein
MSSEALVTQQEVALKEQAITVIQRALMVRITDQESYTAACAILTQEIKPFRKRWAEFWDEIKKPMRQAVNAVQDKFNTGDRPLEQAESFIKSEIRRWDAEQERVRQERQRQAQEEAEAKARQELLELVAIAKDAGAPERQVQEMAATKERVFAPAVQPTYTKAAGVGGRDNWKCRVLDIKALCVAVASGTCPTSYVIGNESVLNSVAKSEHDNLSIPGCEPYNERVISGRSR